MIKRHCDLCDAVIGDFDTKYHLIKKYHIFMNDWKEIELEMCEDCLDKILKAGDIK